jgi:hypothetical protein
VDVSVKIGPITAITPVATPVAIAITRVASIAIAAIPHVTVSLRSIATVRRLSLIRLAAVIALRGGVAVLRRTILSVWRGQWPLRIGLTLLRLTARLG